MKKHQLLIAVILFFGAKAFACQAGFNWEQLPNSLTIHFTSTSTSEHDIISYVWHFGDGQNGDSQNPNHTYAAPGTYNACLIITDNVGCVSDICHMVTVTAVSGDCHASFIWEQIPNTLTMHFNSTSTSAHDIISYQWTFGDGGSATTMDPNHTYNQAGTYNVCLIITDNVGCVSDVCHEVTVAPITSGNCQAGFNWEQLTNTLTIHFINTSTSEHDITSYMWNFGDGHNGDGQNPNHTYAQAGVYNVCLTITDNTGCTSTICHEVTVNPITPGDCEAGFNWEQLTNTLTIHFTNTSTSEHDITSYWWTFGDGHNGDGQNPNHTYAQPGTYTVCLTITDNTGCTSTICHEVTVLPLTPGDCQASFTWEQPANSLNVHFFSTSTSDHEIISRFWDFGDGHTGDGNDPHHIYDQPGTYTVCLTITDNTGCTSTICHEVVVLPVTPGDCHADFNWEQLPGTLTIHFHSTSTSEHDITSYHWNFGDGHEGDAQNPYHTYAQAGTYTVCLTITDNTGCTSTTCHEVTIEPVTPGDCQASFTWEQIPGTLNVHFFSTSTSDHEIVSRFWDFGDGHTGDGNDPHHIYDQPGTYTVCLTITDNSGCTSTVCYEVVVLPIMPGDCQAGFNWEQYANLLTIHFANTSTSEHDITSYMWNFGDGHNGDGQNPNHTYAQAGTYTVCLTITDNTGCTSTICHEVVVEPVTPGECQAEFNWEQLNNTLTEHFHSLSTSDHDITSYMWNFGDGHTGDGVNPYHTYEQPGTYTVCLTITDNTGCTSTICHEIVVAPVSNNCEAEFIWEQTDSLTIHFFSTSASTHDIISYAWTFGDGGTASTQDPYHTYDQPGVYNVCLVITDNVGCVSEFCVEIAITSPATSGADFEALVGEHPNIFNFNNLSYGFGEHMGWLWEYGDGSTSHDFNGHHAYEHPGTYVVCLTMINYVTRFRDKFCITITFGMNVMDYGPGMGINHAIAPSHGHNGFADAPLIEFRYSNPIKDELVVHYELGADALIGIALYDIAGNRVIRVDQTLESIGGHDLSFSTVTLIPGIYALHVTVGQERIVKTILITQ